MNRDSESALKVAEFLLQIKAVRLSPEEPFSWASGWRSPIYCDNRLTLSYPEVRTYLRQEFVRVIQDRYSSLDAIVGVATGGIAMGALVAQEMGLPFAYVRSDAKGHGMQNRIEGNLSKDDQVVVIEDLISTGGSSLSAVTALRDAGVNVKGMAAIFTYGFDTAVSNFKEAKVELNTLSDYTTLIQQAKHSSYLTDVQAESLAEWRNSPSQWGQQKTN